MIGIDVSAYQGNINFDKVKADGYDFVIIRAGFGKSNKDKWFDQNIKKALKSGLKVGVYWFIYAKDIDHLKHNVKYANAVLNNYRDKLEMGVWADWEYDSDNYRPKLTKEERTLWVKTFIDNMNALGYKCGLYANPDYIKNKFNYKVENKPSLWKYDLWLAYYDVSEAKAKEFNPMIWQKTSKGKVNGINGNVDIDVYFGKIEVEKPKDDSKYAIVDTKKDNLNIRKGNGTKYGIISSFTKGTKVKVITKSGNWWFVEGKDYQGKVVQGYCSKTYLKEI